MLAVVAMSAGPVPSRAVRECAACHLAESKPHPATSMAHAMELPAECSILKSHPLLTFQDGNYSYRIERKGDESIYTVSDGTQTLTVPIGWAFGLGLAGQTYVFEKDGEFYESRVSYFRARDGLDFTLGALNHRPANLTEAAGRIMTADDKVRCFSCHSTDAVEAKKLVLEKLTPGVQCERCHDGAAQHLEAVKRGEAKAARIQDPRTFSSEQVSNFCGGCHRTWEQIAATGILGIADVRFQPYRLTNSRCYDADDPRIRCTSCHNPHEEINRTDTAYDSKCQACHAGGKATARACKVASANCASCHMPKIEIPGSHYKFTDHEIRVARANDPYPD